ncbi:MAG TPA: glycoside hydrolase family 9 protein, partial [Verrucomicrobiae bacterium]|nr:glycoside hydrolase family 9 protein [Verrucomicrobiae bacterium]
DPALPAEWNFVDHLDRLHLPAVSEFVVTVAGTNCPVTAVGFKRRVVYAPLRKRDLRIGNYLYLQLARPISENQKVVVQNSGAKLWPADLQFVAVADPLRWNPAIHVNQVGYLPELPKKAMVGWYLGSLSEMVVPESAKQRQPGGKSADSPGSSPEPHTAFKLIEARTGRSVYQGRLTYRPDHGFPFSCYQNVMEADFSDCKIPGEYRLLIPGMGASCPFFIDDGIAAAFARTYALGLYHQRCGTDNVLPYTRFTRGPCHTSPANIPMPPSRYKFTWDTIAQKSEDFADNPRHTAPRLKDELSQLYPFVKRGRINVVGGHHDAGDYSKYTINSAALIHCLVFAVDAFPNVAALDNLGLPESGDGKSDVLQEAKWEADFIARMQDDDGGFFFLVYPRDREYEYDVPPEQGDPQVVWPKNTAVTAAAVAALAQCASSPEFKKEFPETAALYLKKARLGWAFLERAIAKHGQDGAYQKITHYGNEFMHDDELAWAACEMFLATGDAGCHAKLIAWLNPSGNTRRWGWWRLYEAYGCAIRSYAFAARSGKIKRDQLDPVLLARCEDEIIAAARDQLRRSEDSAYATSFPEETKRSLGAGWYFSGDAAFDLAVACQLDYPVLNDPRPKFLGAILGNLNYEAGCNPVNVSFVAGLGWKRPRELVDQYAENQRRILPPSGIPIGNIQAG